MSENVVNIISNKIYAYVFEDYIVSNFLDCINNPEILKKYKHAVGYMSGGKNQNGEYVIGVSLCRPDDFYQYRPRIGKAISIGKIFTSSSNPRILINKYFKKMDIGRTAAYLMEYTLQQNIEYFVGRMNKYFNLTDEEVASIKVVF